MRTATARLRPRETDFPRPLRPRRIALLGAAGSAAAVAGHPADEIFLVCADPSSAALARMEAESAGVPLRTRIGRPARLPFGDGEVDLLHASHQLSGIPDPSGLLREWLRVVRPGGSLLLVERFSRAAPRIARLERLLLECGAWGIAVRASPRPALARLLPFLAPPGLFSVAASKP